jgi:DNA-binding GntR family transcriptional regulator
MNSETTNSVETELRKLVASSSSQGTSADIAYSALRSAINSGVLAPGERLFANDLAKIMCFSRTPVREALRKLEAQDIIQLHPRGGLVVRRMTEQDLLEIYAIREALEGMAARFAAENMSSFDLAEIRNLISEMPLALERDDIKHFRSLILAVHHALARASRNNRLLKLIDELQEIISKMRSSTMRVPGRAAEALEVHRELLAALEKRDGAAAEDIVRRYRRRTFEIRLAQYHAGQISAGRRKPDEDQHRSQ